MASGPITSWQIEEGKAEVVTYFIFLGCKITAVCDCSHEIKGHLLFGRKALANLDSILKAEALLCQQRPISQNYRFSSSHVQIWELDHKEGWAPKNWLFWIVVLEKTLENLLDHKEIKSVDSKGNPPRIFIGRINAEAEAPILWSPDGKRQLIGRGPDSGKDWRQKEKGAMEDEMVR